MNAFRWAILVNVAIASLYFSVGIAGLQASDVYVGVLFTFFFLLNVTLGFFAFLNDKSMRWVRSYLILNIFNGIFALLFVVLYTFLAYPVLILLLCAYLRRSQKQPAVGVLSVRDRIERLGKLREYGIITEQDHRALVLTLEKGGKDL